MEGLELIKLLEKEIHKPEKEKNKPKIKYREYVLSVEGNDVSVLIPLRECSNFEDRVDEIDFIGKYDIMKLLREFRGIRNEKD